MQVGALITAYNCLNKLLEQRLRGPRDAFVRTSVFSSVPFESWRGNLWRPDMTQPTFHLSYELSEIAKEISSKSLRRIHFLLVFVCHMVSVFWGVSGVDFFATRLPRLLLLAFQMPRHLEGPGNVVFRGTSSPSKMWKALLEVSFMVHLKIRTWKFGDSELGKPIIFSGESESCLKPVGICNSFAFLKNDAGNELGVPVFFCPKVLFGKEKNWRC